MKGKGRNGRSGVRGETEEEAAGPCIGVGRCKEKRKESGGGAGKEVEEMRRVSEGKDEGKEKKRSGWGMDG